VTQSEREVILQIDNIEMALQIMQIALQHDTVQDRTNRLYTIKNNIMTIFSSELLVFFSS
jgi:hypothetical protein